MNSAFACTRRSQSGLFADSRWHEHDEVGSGLRGAHHQTDNLSLTRRAGERLNRYLPCATRILMEGRLGWVTRPEDGMEAVARMRLVGVPPGRPERVLEKARARYEELVMACAAPPSKPEVSPGTRPAAYPRRAPAPSHSSGCCSLC
jgi:hypothetical protein